MFISITKPERDSFLAQTNDCLIPGYTGHCPTLKFRVGKRYGANTKEIIKEMNEKGVFKSHLTKNYRERDPLKDILDNGEFRPIERVKGQIKDNPANPKNRMRPYILGYTGYIPGLNYRYGKTYAALADDSLREFNLQKELNDCQKSIRQEYRNRVRSAPKVMQACKPHQLQKALYDMDQQYRNDSWSHISSECPPITGYTGHIPRMKTNEASLSHNFHTAAKKGLYLLQKERESKKNESNAEEGVNRPEAYLTRKVS